MIQTTVLVLFLLGYVSHGPNVRRDGFAEAAS
jgi:hypothetical protein